MSYSDWINHLRNAEKTSTLNGNSRKIHYKFSDGSEMVEEYSMETGVCLRRAWKKKHELRGDPDWETELGEPVRNIEEAAKETTFLVKESSSEVSIRFTRFNFCVYNATFIFKPAFSKRLTKKNIEMRIRNLPYPIETYSVTTDKESIIVRTSNKKYFKQIQIPELKRCCLEPEQENITIHHQYNTLIITVRTLFDISFFYFKKTDEFLKYKKPTLLLEMERDVLLLLKDVETETDLEVDCNELLNQLMG